MKFKDLIKAYKNDFTIAYLTVYNDNVIHIYLRVYPTVNNKMFVCAFRIDSNSTGEHIVFSEKDLLISYNYMKDMEVEDFH